VAVVCWFGCEILISEPPAYMLIALINAVSPKLSKKDDEVIAAADEHNLAMVSAGRRHFRH
jgi:hypothetical protein